MKAKEALQIYKSRDFSERVFSGDKTYLGNKNYRDYSPESTNANDPEPEKYNIRIFVPIDLNKEAILRRLNYIIYEYEEANEKNELSFSSCVYQLIAQIEIYDQIWCIRHAPEEGLHSKEAKELVKEFIAILKTIPDGCADTFPFEMIDELEVDYLQ